MKEAPASGGRFFWNCLRPLLRRVADIGVTPSAVCRRAHERMESARLKVSFLDELTPVIFVATGGGQTNLGADCTGAFHSAIGASHTRSTVAAKL